MPLHSCGVACPDGVTDTTVCCFGTVVGAGIVVVAVDVLIADVVEVGCVVVPCTPVPPLPNMHDPEQP